MSENDCAIITWAIHNYSYCWQKNNEAIISPMFCIITPEETKWKLLLFPRGVASDPTYVAFFLYRDIDCDGSENIKVQYSLDYLESDGTYNNIPITNEFQKDVRKGFSNYLFKIKKGSVYLQNDILTIRCRLFRFNEKAVGMRQIFFRTIIDVKKQYFQMRIQTFSKLASGQPQLYNIKSNSEDSIVIMTLTVTNENNENICFGIDYFDKNMKFFTVKTFITDCEMQEIDFGVYECFSNNGTYPLRLGIKKLMENKNHYFPNDILTLRFEFTLSTGIAFEGIEKSSFECTSHPLPNEVSENWEKCITQKSIYNCSCALMADLTSLHKDYRTCDMKLQTKTNVFPVHTLILSMRSPVFKAMFSNDMKEKLNGCVDVSDLTDETVRRFLLYLYTDHLEDFEWNHALQLFKTADKYAVTSLRDKCSYFLRNNLNFGNACEILMLSDLHLDKDLKESTQNFILKNAKVMFKSEEWKILVDNNPKLALETTLRNWNEK